MMTIGARNWSSHTLLLTAVSTLVACDLPSDDGIDPSRVTLVNEPLAVRLGTSAAYDATYESDGRFVYVAAIAPPTVSGQTLQATSFASDGARAYVVYNTAGAALRGGIETVDLSDPEAPVLRASAVGEEMEFSDVVVHKKYAYAVGSDVHGAVLAVYDVSITNKLREVTRLALPAHDGTSVVLGSSKDAWITTGINGGLVHVDLETPDKPVVLSSQPLVNALYVVETDGVALVLGGETLGVYWSENGSALAPAAAISNSFATAPGRLARHKNRLFTNAAGTGLTELAVAVNGHDLTKVWSSPLGGTGNGIETSANHLFLAQGDGGTLVYDIRQGTPSLVGTFDFPDDRGSANQVRLTSGGLKSGLLQSDGLGGFRYVMFDD